MHQYLLFYKPYGVLSQFRPASTGDVTVPTLGDYVSVPDVYPAGRLDRDSEGLLVLTSDGRLQHQLTDPRFGHPRTYWVQVERVPDAGAIAQLCAGVDIRGYRTRPAEVRLMPEPQVPPRDPPIRFRKQVPTAWLEMTLREGKNRQVRRMTAAVGFPTLRLVRVAIAHLTLQSLQPGDWRSLSLPEVEQLKALVSSQRPPGTPKRRSRKPFPPR